MPPPVQGWGPTGLPPAQPKRHRAAAVVGLIAVVVAIAVVAFVFAGSGSDTDTHQAAPAAKPHADVPKGYTEFADKKDKFSIAVPDTWKAVNPNGPDGQRVWDALVKSNPALAKTIGSGPEAFARGGMRLMAVGRLDPTTMSNPTLNVVVNDAPGVTYERLPDLIGAQRGQMSAAGVTLGELTETKIGGKRAMKAAVTTRLKDPSGQTHEVHGVQSYVLANDSVYIITTNSDDPTIQTMMRTFRVG
jgi:hypothetical protein